MCKPDSLDSLLSDWLSSGKRSSRNTADAYRRDVKAFFKYCGNRQPNEITAKDIAQYQSFLRREYQPASEYRKVSALRSFLAYLKAAKAIEDDLACLIHSPKIESNFKDKAITVDDVQAMIEAAANIPIDSLLVRTLYLTAGRVSEVLALTWADLKPAKQGGGFVHFFGKGRKNREVYIGQDLWDDLVSIRGEIADGERLFPIDRFEAFAIVKKLAKAAKVTANVSPHVFRHSLASHVLEDGGTLAQVRDRLGHSDIKTTSLYVHSTEDSGIINGLKVK